MATGAGEKDLRRALMEYALGSGCACGRAPSAVRSDDMPSNVVELSVKARTGDRDREASLSR